MAAEQPSDKRPEGPAVSPDLVERVFENFRQREREIETAAFTWIRSLNHSAVAVALKAEHEALFIKRGKVRYETMIANLTGSNAGNSKLITAFDGETRFSHQPGASAGRGQGVMGKATTSDDLQNMHLIAIFLAVMPCHPDLLGNDSANWEAGKKGRVIEGSRCIELRPKAEFRSGRLYRRIWVDPARSFAIRHFEEVTAEDKPVVVLSINYDRELARPWIPSSWEAKAQFGESSSERSENTMSTAIINEPLADDLFKIKYPPGTIVFDKNQNEEAFVVGNDGRLLPRGDDLVNASTMGVVDSGYSKYGILLGINLLIAAVVVSYLIYRRMQKAR